MTDSIEVLEVGPRDGLQNEPAPVPTVAKVELIDRLLDAGVTRLETTSFVHPAAVPQLADADEVMAAVARPAGVVHQGLVLNERGFDRAVAARCDEINVIVVVTDAFSERNQGMTTGAMLDVADVVAGRAAEAGIPMTVTLSAAFGCPFSGEVDPGHVEAIAGRVGELRPAQIALADTIGVGVPAQVHDLFGRCRRAAPGTALRAHFHNTRNTGYANALAAIDAGVVTLDASVGGIGGCPFAPDATGNIATEDLVYVLERSGISTGLDLDRLMRAAEFVGELVGREVPGQMSRAGRFPAR
ncbi:hydroxymethylglutaryl-CoA lyase [Ilumatobacter sp.]|uniref:hydroxymethylglutaryl-CoA lyase n=1 Tax=Ilumatobacter sp. TaxID=1967498 RepID=UPI003B524C2B